MNKKLRYSVCLSVLLKSCIVIIMALPSCSNTDIEKAKKLEAEGWNRLPLILSRIVPPTFPKLSFNVLDEGAKNDSIFDNRSVVQQLIDSCAQLGGGKIIFPAGQYYLDGPLHLKSNINLHLQAGARLFFSSKPSSYLPAVKVRWEGTIAYNYSPLIYAYQAKNIAITGTGEIDGAAAEWSREWRKLQKPDKAMLRQMGNDVIPLEQRVFANGFLDLNKDGIDDGFGDGQQHYLRPALVMFYECNNILLEESTYRNSPFWTIHPVFCKNVTIRNLKVYGNTLNDDGIDPDSCEDVLIEGCEVQTEDDAISIKAGRDQDAWERPGSKNIVVRNNRLLSGVNALCIGSEMSGVVSNVFAENNYIDNGKHALNFKCNLDRGGEVHHIYIRDTQINACEDAMFIFRMDYHGYRGNNYPTKFHHFFVSDIQCGKVQKKPFKIVGVEAEPIANIYISNVNIESAGEDSQFEYAKNIFLNNVTVGGKTLDNTPIQTAND